MAQALRCGVLVLAFLASHQAHAETPNVGVRGLPGLVHVGLPVPAADTLVAAGTVGYGYLDATSGQAAAGRGLGSLALAFSPLPQLTFGADFAGWRDSFDDGVNLYGEPRLTARYAIDLPAAKYLGFQLDARFIGADAPSIRAEATSPSLRALYGARLAGQTWLGAEVGFQFDQSAAAIPELRRLSATDERTLSASSWYSLPVGVGVAHDVTASWQLLAEVSGDLLVGQDSPGLLQSPLRATAAVRHALSRSWTVQAGLEAALSKRDDVSAAQTLPREPRVSGFLGLVWLLPRELPRPLPSVKKLPTPLLVAKPQPVEAPKPPPSAPVSGTLVDEGGRALADVEVVLLRLGVELGRERTTAEGQFSFPDVALGAVVLRVNESGYDAVDVTLEAEPRTAELVLRPAVPAGQVRGKVLDLQGNPVMAQVTVNPGELNLTAAVDGAFELDLAPGRYTVRFEHPNFVPQKRTIVLKDHGVVILNIGLVR